jgi:hypothetical protein
VPGHMTMDKGKKKPRLKREMRDALGAAQCSAEQRVIPESFIGRQWQVAHYFALPFFLLLSLLSSGLDKGKRATGIAR